MCVQEEERLVMKLGESAFMVTTRGKNKTNKHQANQKAHQQGKGKIPPQADIKKKARWFFCKRKGHMKKKCMKF